MTPEEIERLQMNTVEFTETALRDLMASPDVYVSKGVGENIYIQIPDMFCRRLVRVLIDAGLISDRKFPSITE